MSCDRAATGAVELFYGELPERARRELEDHVRGCADCRRTLDELGTIRAALTCQEDVDAPPGRDWRGFTERLQRRLADNGRERALPSHGPARAPLARAGVAAWVAMAALLAIVTASVLTVVRERPADRAGTASRGGGTAPPPAPTDSAASAPALLAVSSGHFQRSKLVLLGLSTRDPEGPADANWTFERALAIDLLDDTRLFRRAAEDEGMRALADVMRDLEIVLLQTSMAERSDERSLEQIQRLIRQRDLLPRMVVYESGWPDGPDGLAAPGWSRIP